MKALTTILVLLSLSILLCGCPYSSSYSIDDTPTIYVEDGLLGKWATFVKKPGFNKEEPVKMVLTKKNDTEYNIAFTGYLDELKRFGVVQSDSISGTAFMSTVGKYQFLNITIKNKIYIAQLVVKDESLSLLPLVEHFTAKMVHNNIGLRTAVDYHYKMRVHPLVDEDFCLRDLVRVN
jgi:hypothetical protein